jgi:hypothetical protein
MTSETAEPDGEWDYQLTEYEFQEPENALMLALASSLGRIGLLFSLVGCLYVGGALLSGAALSVTRSAALPVFVPTFLIFAGAAAVAMFSGSWMRGSARKFHSIATSEGRDMEHLMEAIGQLTRLYRLWAVLLVLGLLYNLYQLVQLNR